MQAATPAVDVELDRDVFQEPEEFQLCATDGWLATIKIVVCVFSAESARRISVPRRGPIALRSGLDESAPD
jgi:hypothetical protein